MTAVRSFCSIETKPPNGSKVKLPVGIWSASVIISLFSPPKMISPKPIEEQRDADRRHEQDDVRLIDQRAQHDALDGDGEDEHDQRASSGTASSAGTPFSWRADQRQRREHHHDALREIEDARGFVDQHEAERDQRVEDAATRPSHSTCSRKSGAPAMSAKGFTRMAFRNP